MRWGSDGRGQSTERALRSGGWGFAGSCGSCAEGWEQRGCGAANLRGGGRLVSVSTVESPLPPPRASQRREMSSAHGAAPYPGSVTRARTHAPRAAQSGAVPSGRAALGPPRNPRPQHSAAPRASGARGGGGGAVRSGAERGSGRRCGWGCAAAAGAALTVRGTSRHRPAGMRLRPAWHGRTERGGVREGLRAGYGGWYLWGRRGCIPGIGGLRPEERWVSIASAGGCVPGCTADAFQGWGRICAVGARGGVRARQG